MRRPDRIYVGMAAVVLGCAIECVGLSPWGIEKDRLEAAAVYRETLTMGCNVRNCQRPLISESGADKETRILAISDGTSTLAGALAAVGA